MNKICKNVIGVLKLFFKLVHYFTSSPSNFFLVKNKKCKSKILTIEWRGRVKPYPKIPNSAHFNIRIYILRDSENAYFGISKSYGSHKFLIKKKHLFWISTGAQTAQSFTIFKILKVFGTWLYTSTSSLKNPVGSWGDR